MLENEAAIYAENENFDAADDTQRRADVLKKEIDFYKKHLKPATQDWMTQKVPFNSTSQEKGTKKLNHGNLQKSIMILLDNY